MGPHLELGHSHLKKDIEAIEREQKFALKKIFALEIAGDNNFVTYSHQ